MTTRRHVSIRSAALLSTFALLFGGAAAQAAPEVETLVFLRHGEKPEQGLGQLNCQGLNRALALPAVLTRQFGAPTHIIAPDPSDQIDDHHGVSYDYVRPLATIEPTAIKLGLPVNTSLGQTQTDELRQLLDAPQYKNAMIFIAWGHHGIQQMVPQILHDHGGNPDAAPARWPDDDYDSLYVVKIVRGEGTAERAEFRHLHQGLDGQPQSCG